MSVRESACALKVRGINDRQYRVLSHLAECSDFTGRVDTPIGNLVERVECSADEIWSAISGLVDAGLLGTSYVKGDRFVVEDVAFADEVFGPIRSPADQYIRVDVTPYRKKEIPKSLRKKVFERDLYRCRHCDTHLELTCDHVIPESRGGPTTLENLQTLCRSCNSKKGRKMPAEAETDV